MRKASRISGVLSVEQSSTITISSSRGTNSTFLDNRGESLFLVVHRNNDR